jgi:hypothetical protein
MFIRAPGSCPPSQEMTSMRNYREARTEDEKSDSRLTGPEASRCWECALKTNIRFEGKGAFLLAFLFREACPGEFHRGSDC